MSASAADPTGETAPSGPVDEGPGELTQTEAFELLGNDRRRYALHHLMDVESAEIGEIAEHVAAWENGIDVTEVHSEQRRRAYVSLHQTHLPRLDNANVLEYESTREEIELTETGEDLRVYMDIVQSNNIPWSQFYLGLSVFGVSMLLFAWLDFYPFSVGPDAAYALGMIGLFSITSLVHVLRDRQNRLGGSGDPPTC